MKGFLWNSNKSFFIFFIKFIFCSTQSTNVFFAVARCHDQHDTHNNLFLFYMVVFSFYNNIGRNYNKTQAFCEYFFKVFYLNRFANWLNAFTITEIKIYRYCRTVKILVYKTRYIYKCMHSIKLSFPLTHFFCMLYIQHTI